MHMQRLGYLAIVFGLLSFAACSNPTQPSSNPPPPSVPALTPTQINAIQSAVGPALSLAFSHLGSRLSTFRSRAGFLPLGVVHPESTTPIGASAACPESGTISVSGTVTDNTNSNGSGSAGLNIQIGFSSCRSAGILIQGNPSLSITAQVNLSDFNLVNPATFTLGGGITFVLNNVTGSASFNCAGGIDVNTFSVSESGNVTLQYPSGQNTTTVSCSGF
jgi:hypothetical protein